MFTEDIHIPGVESEFICVNSVIFGLYAIYPILQVQTQELRRISLQNITSLNREFER